MYVLGKVYLLCSIFSAISYANGMSKSVDEDLWGTTDENINDLNYSKAGVTVEEDEIIFRYYNKDYNSGEIIYIKNASRNTLKGWRDYCKLAIITHGWLSSDKSMAVEGIKDAYLAKMDINIITVDWSESASWKAYPLPAYMTGQVGTIVARLIDLLVEQKMTVLSNVHIIGHSLGSHVAGASGAAVQHGRVGRITGLDPAGPAFEVVHYATNNVLDTSDADFVDVIHTAGKAAGYYGILGHADFYPNGGVPIQPGCLESNSIGGVAQSLSCSHGRAYEFFKDSILYPYSFKAVRCDNWESFENHSCDKNPITFMGDGTPNSARGVFYLRTKSSSPYGNVSDVE